MTDAKNKKRCSTCGRFHTDLHAYCDHCYDVKRKWEAVNRERHRAYKRDWTRKKRLQKQAKIRSVNNVATTVKAK